MKAYNLWDHYQQKLKGPLLDQNVLSKSIPLNECCDVRFTSFKQFWTVFMLIVKHADRNL